MEKIRESFVQCGQCGTKFRLPFFIGDTKTFFYAVLWAKCPNWGITIDCNKDNMSYVLEDEGSPPAPIGL
jgi:hypothetical protein